MSAASEPPSHPVAVVSGAARGIGAAISLRLAQDGCHVAVLDLDAGACGETVAAVRSAGGQSMAAQVDVSDEASVAAAISRVTAKMGPPTVLVNNAGIQRDHMMSRMTVAEWDAVMSVHLRGAFLMSRAVQAHMKQVGWGRIVNISSTAALGNLGQSNYSAAKAGLQGFTRTLALELGRYNVTVNAVAPGFTVTEMTRETARRVGVSFEQMEADMVAQIPVGRAGHPQDIAHAVAFFADARSGFISGQVLYVAGGPRS